MTILGKSLKLAIFLNSFQMWIWLLPAAWPLSSGTWARPASPQIEYSSKKESTKSFYRN